MFCPSSVFRAASDLTVVEQNVYHGASKDAPAPAWPTVRAGATRVVEAANRNVTASLVSTKRV